jgi:UDP-N-acetylglucosamine acyltransferase
MIHPTAIIEDGAQFGENVEIGPYCHIGSEAKIGNGTKLASHVSVVGRTEIGERCSIHPFASLGGDPQDKTYKGEDTACNIGDGNIIREYVTINRASTKQDWVTRVGNNNFIMAYSHIGHDCVVGNGVTMANGATLAGHVEVEDYVTISGPSAVHQFCRIGESAMISGLTGMPNDIIPFVTAAAATGGRARLFGLNIIGLQRRGFTRDEITTLKQAYRILFRSSLLLKDALEKIESELTGDHIRHLLTFIRSSKRGICR